MEANKDHHHLSSNIYFVKYEEDYHLTSISLYFFKIFCVYAIIGPTQLNEFYQSSIFEIK